MSGITPCFWFDGNAEEAATFYAYLFPNSHVDAVHRQREPTSSNLAHNLTASKRNYTMKAGVIYPQIELGGDTGAVKAFAQAAEDLGYDHI